MRPFGSLLPGPACVALVLHYFLGWHTPPLLGEPNKPKLDFLSKLETGFSLWTSMLGVEQVFNFLAILDDETYKRKKWVFAKNKEIGAPIWLSGKEFTLSLLTWKIQLYISEFCMKCSENGSSLWGWFLQSVDGRKQSSMCVGILVSCICFSRVFFIKDENMCGHVKAFQVLQESICQWVIAKIRLINKEK